MIVHLLVLKYSMEQSMTSSTLGAFEACSKRKLWDVIHPIVLLQILFVLIKGYLIERKKLMQVVL